MKSELIESQLARISPLFDESVVRAVKERWDSLTKPPGSLGRLEDLVLHLALIQGTPDPRLERKAMFVFCADHGVTAQRVSAYPREVTRQMVANFVAGGAAISVLCRELDIDPVVVDMGVAGPAIAGAVDLKTADGTRDFALETAMSPEQAVHAVEMGIQLAQEAAPRFDIAGIGEMGIGNTTAATAILCAVAGCDAPDVTGPGAGLDEKGITHKTEIIQKALILHRPNFITPMGVLQSVGGFEIAGMTGFLLGAAAARLPVVVDGFIATSAALLAQAMARDSVDAMIFSHHSAEPGHARMLEILGVQPYLDLDLRLGEGTGSALTMLLLNSAIDLYRHMATFEEAGVAH